MGSHGGGDARVVFPASDEVFHAGHHGRPVGIVGGGEVDDGLSEDAAHSDAVGFFGHYTFEHIHVDDAGGAAAQHFPEGQLAAHAHEFGVERFGFHGEDVVVEPVHQLFVVGQAAEERHWGVGVAVDEAGHEQAAGALGFSNPRILSSDLVGWADGHDGGSG